MKRHATTLTMPTVVRVYCGPINLVGFPKHTRDNAVWVISARWRTGRLELAPLRVATGTRAAEPLSVLVNPPPGCYDLSAGFYSGSQWNGPFGLWNPVLMVEPHRHDPARQWYAYDLPRISFQYGD